MKKIISIITVIIIPFISFSQAIEQGNFEFSIGTGLGIYETSDNDTTNKNSTAVAGILNMSCQFAIANRLSIGIVFDRNGYAQEKDSLNKAHSLNALINAQLRIVNALKTIIYLNLSGGYTNFKYIEGQHNLWVSGGGFILQPGIGFKHYFGKTVGFYIQSDYTTFNYKQLKDSENTILKIGPANNLQDFQLKLSGLNIRTGLTFKF